MRDTIYRDDAIRVASGYCHPANVVKELEKLPSAEPDTPMRGSKVAETAGNITDRTTGDCISRQAVINTVNNMRKTCDTENIDDYRELMLEAVKALTPSPSRPQIPECPMCPDCPDNCPLEVEHDK